MQINVSQLLKAPIGTTQDYKVSETIDVAGDGKGRRVTGGVRLMRTHRGILVKGQLQTVVELTCSRCLSLFDYPVTINFEEEFTPTVDVVSGNALPTTGETGSFVIDERHIIDLSEAIRQYTLLTVPMKPLCRKDCAGLCSKCGRNLNQGPCGCPQEVSDTHWSELSKLLDK